MNEVRSPDAFVIRPIPPGAAATGRTRRPKIRRPFAIVSGVVIVGLLLALVFWKPEFKRPPGGEAAQEAARLQMRAIGAAIDLYTTQYHTPPDSLDVLTLPDEKLGEPFLRSIPLDPWKGTYTYRVEAGPPRQWSLVSSGEDRRLGTHDDLAISGTNARDTR